MDEQDIAPELDFSDRMLEQGRLFLEAQLAAGLAADQRATTVATFFATLAAALIAASLAYWDKTRDVPILVAGLGSSSLMIVGASICLWAARPVEFFFAGNYPEHWQGLKGKPLAEILYGEALNYQGHIEKNESILNKNSRAIWLGAMLGVGSPLLAIALWLCF